MREHLRSSRDGNLRRVALTACSIVAVTLLALAPTAPGHPNDDSNHCSPSKQTDCHFGGGASTDRGFEFIAELPGGPLTLLPGGYTVANLSVDENTDGDTTDPGEKKAIHIGEQNLNTLGGELGVEVFKAGGQEPQASITSMRRNATTGSCEPNSEGAGRRISVSRTGSASGFEVWIKDGGGQDLFREGESSDGNSPIGAIEFAVC